jgi:hypothetical protein
MHLPLAYFKSIFTLAILVLVLDLSLQCILPQHTLAAT